jgi:hypothetical protein
MHQRQAEDIVFRLLFHGLEFIKKGMIDPSKSANAGMDQKLFVALPSTEKLRNFLDIFTAVVQLPHFYHPRGFVHRLQLIGLLCKIRE